MIEQQKLEAINLFLDKEDYESAISSLEQYIEETPEELIYYWYLGLVYLLQESSEEAQNIWLSVFLQGNLQEVEQWIIQLTQFLENQVQKNINKRKLGNAKIIYEAIQSINQKYENAELLNNLVESLCNFASGLSHEKEIEESVKVYLEIINLNPNHAITWNSLAVNYYYLEQYSEAEKAIRKAIELNNSDPANYYGLGLILERIENYSCAIDAYQQAIKHNSKFIESYNRLGSIYLQQNLTDKATEIYKIAADIAPTPADASMIFFNLGNIYKTTGKSSQCEFYFGLSYYYSNQYELAIIHFESFLETQTNNIEVYRMLAYCYIFTNQHLLAIFFLEKILILFPNDLPLQRLNQLILPILYQDIEEIDFYRNRFCQLLKKLIEGTEINTAEQYKNAFKSFQFGTNFLLAYQGKNDLEIQKEYSGYVHTKIMKKKYPQLCQSIHSTLDISKRKIRIGYISLRLHGLGALYLGWLKYSNKNKFEIYIYDISGFDSNIKDGQLELREYFKIYSDDIQFIPSTNVSEICEKVLADNLNILIFPEIGLDAYMTPLSCLRLAPIQCTTWAHPITSGSPSIDYFLSSDLMEPENGDEHYSETLVRLPNLGFSLEHPELTSSEKKRSDFQLRDDAIIYFCCQTLFKYLPQYDYIFPAIAQQNTLAQFVFLDSYLGPVITNYLKKRIDKAFSKFNLNYEKYCIFLPQQCSEDYVRLNQLSDIFLDSFSWSGGISTAKAIACSLPVVTCPGEMMRSRHSYGILHMIEVTDTIAETEAEYIEIAVRLGFDHEWRQTLRDKITANKHRLFNDQECVKGLENFFEEAVHKHSQMKLISGDL